MPNADTPLAGIRVVDLSQGIAGPYCAMLLAQHGADVIKVEPLEGDWSRTLGARYGDQTAFSVVGNLGKRSIALDLKQRADHIVLKRLARRADVFIEGFRPGVAKRLGADYPAIAALSPRVIYLSVSGFGQTGPERDRPAMDPVLQAFTGMMHTNRGADGLPHRVGTIVVDMGTGLYCAQAVLAALFGRGADGPGRYIDASLMTSAAGLQSVHLMAHHLEGGQMRPGRVPSGCYRTADGWLQITIHRDEEFRRLCDVLEAPDLRDDPRFATHDQRGGHLDELTARVTGALARQPTATWCGALRAAGLMHERVNTLLEFLSHPHVAESGALEWIEQPAVGKVPIPRVAGLPPLAPGDPRGVAPGLDQHRAEILRELGFSPASAPRTGPRRRRGKAASRVMPAYPPLPPSGGAARDQGGRNEH
jgi:crotonobetainyl-CoA:carnitine CoA-transferase CaiB-like acyl-CoA transferase